MIATVLAAAPSGAAISSTPFVAIFTIFVLAIFVGYYVVWGVTPALHTPLMAVTNALSSIVIVGAMLLDPASYILKSPVSSYRSISNVGATLQNRQIYTDQIDDILYKSADSYAQARLVYLQNRRFKLKDSTSDAYIDPYEDFE